MMNTGNMQGMMGPRGGVMGPQQMQNQNSQYQRNRFMQQEVLRVIQQHQLPPGWKQTLPIQNRAYNIIQLKTQLGLMKQMPPEQALEIAASFERETLIQSVDKAAYDKACRDKLSELHMEREKQAMAMQPQFLNPHNGQMNMGMQQVPMQNGIPTTRPAQFQQGFPNPQLQRAMQPTPMPTQQQFMQNFNQQQQHAINNNMSNPQTQMQNSTQNTSRPMINNIGPFDAQESAQIAAMAQQMRNGASAEEIERAKQKLSLVDDKVKRMWQQNRVDPLAQYYRNIASKQFAQRKAQQHQNQPSMMSRIGTMPQQPISMPQSAASTAPPQIGAIPQGFDPSFGGNMRSQILGLQQEALRSQEEGQVVVPASGNPKAPQQQQQGMMHPTPHQQPMNQPTPSRSVMNPSQFMQPDKMQQIARTQAQERIQNAGMQNQMQAPQNSLQGQAGGLNGHMNPALPQQSPDMPHLNRPLGPSAQLPQKQGPSQLRQPGPPQVQAKDAGSSNQQSQQQLQGQPSGGGASQLGISSLEIQNFPFHMQQRLTTMTFEQQQAFLLQYRKAMNARNQPAKGPQANGTGMASQQFQNGPAQSSQGHPINQPTPGQTPALALQNFGVFDQSLNQPQKMPTPGEQTVHRLFDQQFRPQQTPQPPRPSQGPANLTDEQIRLMDQQIFPPKLLNANILQSFPPQGVRLWGELKAWAAQNQGSMPTDIVGTLKNFQAAHFAQMAKRPIGNQQRQGQTSSAQTSMSSAPVQHSGPAPPAPMRGNPPQAPTSTPIPMTVPQNMPPFQQPSAEDLQNLRMRYPKAQHVPDDELRQQLMRQKMAQYRTAVAQQRRSMNPQQVQYENMQRAQQLQQLQRPPFLMNGQNSQVQPQSPAIQGQQAVSHAVKVATPLMGQGTVQEPPHSQPSRPPVRPPIQNQQSQKGTKRVNEDDVVEVPNPKLAHQQQQRRAQPPGKQAPSQPKPSPSQAVHDPTLPPQQQSNQHANEPRTQAAQPAGYTQQHMAVLLRNQPKTPQENLARQQRYRQIFEELSKNTVTRTEVPMDSQMRNEIISFLTKYQPILTRASTAIPNFFVLTNNEETIKDLIQSEILFSRQYRGEQFVDRFTASLTELQEASRKMIHSARLMQSVQRFKQQSSSQTQQSLPLNGLDSSIGSANVATVPNKAAPEAQMRQATALQRNHSNRESRAPAAPTSDKPPFSFGALSPPSGDGVPIAYGPTSVTQDKLTIPPTKKRKIQNQSGSTASTPAQAHGTPATTTSPKVAKTSSPRVQRSNVAPASTIKCPESSCEFAVKGFATMEDLNKHKIEKHPVVEPPIEDPFLWALEGVRMGLGLSMDICGDTVDRNHEWVKNMVIDAEKTALAPASMKKSASMQGLTPMKMEGGTPMSRMASQAGQSNSGIPRTPQKTPVSDGKQPTPKRGQAESTRVGSTPGEPSTPPNNLWKDTSILPSDLSSLFPSPWDLQGLSLATLTPASTLSSSKSAINSPKESDIGEDDLLEIRIESDSWKPDAWKSTLVEEDGVYAFKGNENWADAALDDDLLLLSWDDAFEKLITPTEEELKKMPPSMRAQVTPFDAGKYRWQNT